MANVLPPQARKQVWRMYRARFITALSIGLLILALFAYLALIPSYLALRFAAPAAAKSEISHGTSTPSAAADINRAQLLLAALAPALQSTTSPAALIEDAVSQRPRGIAVTTINYDQTDGKIMLTGSGARDGINAYRDALSRDATFSSVSIPVSALVGANGQFSMTLVLAH